MSKLLWATLLISVATICACSSISKKQTLEPITWPPLSPDDSLAVPSDETQRLELRLKQNPSESMGFQVHFLEAKQLSEKAPDKACEMWLKLAAEPRFPIYSVARIYAIETCPVAHAEISAFEELLPDSLPKWLREKSIRAGLARAGRGVNISTTNIETQSKEIQLSLDLVAFVPVQSGQIVLINRAIELSKSIKNAQVEELSRETLYRIAPRFIAEPQPEQFAAIAADFRRARDFNKAREFYKKDSDRVDVGDFEKLRALDGIRMTYKLEGQHEKYLQATREYSDFARTRFYLDDSGHKRKSAPHLAKYVETRITLARAIWNENSAQDAQKILSELERELKGRPPSEKILFLRAKIEEEAGHLDQTIKILSQIDESTINDRTERMKVLWYRAWDLRKLSRFNEAAEVLGRMISDETSASVLARDHFWLGRTLKDKGDLTGAKGEFNWLTANDPIGYYGMLSYRELNERLPPLLSLTSQVGDSSSAQALSPEERMTFEWLIGTGETDLARKFLDQFDSVRRATFTEEQVLDYLRLYARAGSYQDLFSRISELDPERRTQILLRQPELIFPRPWPGLIHNAAEKFHVPSELVYSIMRQESSFNPTARSIADAFGLMQLIPESASQASLATGIQITSNDELYLPEMNIPLGVAFFRGILDKWHGHFIPAVASYNANEVAVERWMKTRDVREPLQFIEDIPYEETRNYVKLVLRNFIFYSRLSSNSETVAFPEWCLAGLQDTKP